MRLDLLITGANVRTMVPERPRADRIGIWNGRIVGVDEEVDGLKAADVIDLGGGTVLPGFIDAHTHLQLTGQALTAIDIGGLRSVDEVLGRIEEEAGHLPADAWVEVGGYDQRPLGRDLTNAELDRAAGGRRVWARHISSHSSVVSSAVIERIGDADIRERVSANHGLLTEHEQDHVRNQRTPYGVGEAVEAVAVAADAASRDGITFCIEAGAGGRIGSINPLDLETYDRLRVAGRLPLRLQVMPSHDALHGVVGGEADGFSQGLDLGLRTGMGSDMLSIGPLKFIFDGGMMVRTARLSEPYAGTDSYGMFSEDPRIYREQMIDAVAAGWQLAVHAIGDAALDSALDAFEAAFAHTPEHHGRHRIEHGGLIRDDQVSRLAVNNLAVVTQACFLWNFGEDYSAQLGTHRVPWLYRGRSLLDAGVPVIQSTDRPLDGTPLQSIQTAVERKSSHGVPLAPHEAVTIHEAVEAWTVGGAWAAGMDDRLGRIRAGHIADLVVLDADPYDVAVHEIGQIPVRGTVFDGEPIRL